MSESLSQITNFVLISGTLGTSGQPTVEQLADIRNAGYELVVNLATATSENAIHNEGELVAEQGLDYVHIPVDWDAPAREDFERFAQTLNDNPDQKIWVHCALNMRASAFTFLYRIIHGGVDPSEAKEPMGRLWDPTGVWEELLDEILADHGVDYFDID